MPETTTMPETAQQEQQTTKGTDKPEHHQTQAATGSPQAGGAPTTGSSGMSGSAPGSSATANASTTGSQTGGISSGGQPATGIRRRGGLTPASLLGDPLGMMRSVMDQMDRFLDDFVGLGGPSRYRQGTGSGLQSSRGGTGAGSLWYPQIEVSERGGNLVVCADLPGLRKEDVHLEIHDDYLLLQGERRSEQEENQSGVYRSERSYGRFEVTVPLPTQEQRQGRRIEIQ